MHIYPYICLNIIIRYRHIDTCISVDAKKPHQLMKDSVFNNSCSKKWIFRIWHWDKFLVIWQTIDKHNIQTIQFMDLNIETLKVHYLKTCLQLLASITLA
mgnify:CR=1 FL=1